MDYAKKLFEEKKYKRALVEFLKEEVVEEEYKDLAYYLGLCYCRLKEYDEALLYLEQVISFANEDSKIYQCKFIIGYIHTELSNFILAEREFRKLLELKPNDIKIYSALAHNLLKQGKLGEAKNFASKGLDINPEQPQILNSMACILCEMYDDKEKLKKAIIFSKKSVEKRPFEAAYLDTLGWIYYKLGDFQDSIMFLSKANNIMPHNPEIKEHLKIAYEKNNTAV